MEAGVFGVAVRFHEQGPVPYARSLITSGVFIAQRSILSRPNDEAIPRW
jgi:hypothetical protein